MAMYTTIEPRLIALLNDSTSSSPANHPRVDLPPLQNPNILKTSGRPSPIEPNTTARGGNHVNTPGHKSTLREVESSSIGTNARFEDGSHGLAPHVASGRVLGGTSPQSLRKILDSEPEEAQNSSNKKRHRPGNSKDDFVQLPQLPKKQKTAGHVVPPIIIGLLDPPKNAAMFPPIEPSSFHDSRGRNSLNIEPMQEPFEGILSTDHRNFAEDNPEIVSDNKSVRLKVRRKWTEEETQQMLLGVQKHGIGSWTKIIQDPEFKFNDRKAVDIKDRFRTCCPIELRSQESDIESTEETSSEFGKQQRATSPSNPQILYTENNYASSDADSTEDGPIPNRARQKSKAHRKKLEDLVQLGIDKPFKKSQRRRRRPFSDEEDRNILLGFTLYGPSWSMIQKDARFGLGSRRPTDLRDRLRNKYPEKFFQANDEMCRKANKDLNESIQKENVEKSSLDKLSLKLQSPEAPIAQERTSVAENLGISETKATNKLPKPLLNPLYNVKDPFLDLAPSHPVSEAADPFSFSHPFDWVDNITPFSSSMGEMDISRLLLDETWTTMPTSNMKPKNGTADSSGGAVPIVPAMSQLLPLYGTNSLAGWETSQTPSLILSEKLGKDSPRRDV